MASRKELVTGSDSVTSRSSFKSSNDAEQWATASGLLNNNSKTRRSGPLEEEKDAECSRLSRSKSTLTGDVTIKNKKKSSSPVARPVEQLSSMLVHSLDDDEFRNMLSIAAKPRYGTISNTKKFDSNTREMMNNGKNDEDDNKGKISVTTKLILHEMQRVAEEKQRKDDIEADQRNSTVTAFIKDTSSYRNKSNSNGRSVKCTNQGSSYSNARRSSNDHSTDGWSDVGGVVVDEMLRDSEKCDSEVAIGETSDHFQSTKAKATTTKTSEYRLSNVSRKPDYTIIDIGECVNEQRLERDAATNTASMATIAFIDEDEHDTDDKSVARISLSKDRPASKTPREYTQGNIVHEMHALNESYKEERFVSSDENKSLSMNRKVHMDHSTNDVDRKQQNETKLDYDENSFPYTCGQLHVRNNKQSSYEMGSDGSSMSAATTTITDHLSKRSVEEQMDGYTTEPSESTSWCTQPISLNCADSGGGGSLMANISSSTTSSNARQPSVQLFSEINAATALLEHSLQPAHYNPSEQFARNYLQPTENTFLPPNPAIAVSPQDGDMANLKAQQPDKCALAKKRKEKRKQKEQENVYVVKSSDGYIGNLSPDEIVRRIEGDEKGDKIDEKTKSKSSAAQKAVTSSNTNNHTLKDIPSAPLSVVSKTVKDTSSKRKSDKDKRHNGSTDKVMYSPKRSAENGNVEVSNAKVDETAIATVKDDVNDHTVHSTNSSLSSSTSTIRLADNVVPAKRNTNAANNDNDSNTGNNCSEQSSDGDSGAATVCIADEEMIIRTDEEVGDVDDEEQYMSADEGVNSGASDDVYHTDELSGTSGSRDLMSDGGNFRADDEPVIPNSAAAEEAEFIPVTAKSRKKTAPPAINVDKKHSYTGIVDKGGNSRGGGALKDGGMGLRQRRNSAQLTIETGISSRAYHHSPSPNERVVQKYSGPPTRRQLNSLADYIEDNTVIKAQSHKWSQHGSKWHGNSSGMQSKGTVERVPASSSLHTSRAASPDRRSSQPSNCPISNARYAAAVANTSHKVLPSDLTVYSTGNQGSFAKALLSPPLKDGNKTSAHVPSQSLRGTLHTSVSGSALNDTKKNSLIYDPSDENANPPLPSARRAPNSDPNMTNTVNTHVAIPSRSWADIAKSSRVTTTATCSAVNGNGSGATLTCKSRINDSTQTQTCSSDESVPREMTSPSSSNVSNPERASSVDSSANDSTETAKESECAVASCSISSDVVITQIPDNDEGIRLQGISFFYDPNEPTANFDQRTPIDFSATDLEDFSTSTPIAKCSQESAIFISDDRIPSNDSPKSDNQNSEKETICDKKDAPPNSVVLNLENGKTITLPAMGTNDLSKVVLVEDRKHVMLVEQLARHWKNFEQCGPAPIRYKELMKKRPKATKTSTKNNIANVKTAKC